MRIIAGKTNVKTFFLKANSNIFESINYHFFLLKNVVKIANTQPLNVLLNIICTERAIGSRPPRLFRRDNIFCSRV